MTTVEAEITPYQEPLTPSLSLSMLSPVPADPINKQEQPPRVLLDVKTDVNEDWILEFTLLIGDQSPPVAVMRVQHDNAGAEARADAFVDCVSAMRSALGIAESASPVFVFVTDTEAISAAWYGRLAESAHGSWCRLVSVVQGTKMVKQKVIAEILSKDQAAVITAAKRTLYNFNRKLKSCAAKQQQQQTAAVLDNKNKEREGRKSGIRLPPVALLDIRKWLQTQFAKEDQDHIRFSALWTSFSTSPLGSKLRHLVKSDVAFGQVLALLSDSVHKKKDSCGRVSYSWNSQKEPKKTTARAEVVAVSSRDPSSSPPKRRRQTQQQDDEPDQHQHQHRRIPAMFLAKLAAPSLPASQDRPTATMTAADKQPDFHFWTELTLLLNGLNSLTQRTHVTDKVKGAVYKMGRTMVLTPDEFARQDVQISAACNYFNNGGGKPPYGTIDMGWTRCLLTQFERAREEVLELQRCAR